MLTFFGHIVYSKLAVSVFDTSFFMNLALLSGSNLFASTAGEDTSMSAYILIGVAFAQFIGLVLFKMFSILKQNEKVMKCFRKGHHVEDDWEFYEEAALQREMEPDTQDVNDSDDGGSEECGSIESLPTY